MADTRVPPPARFKRFNVCPVGREHRDGGWIEPTLNVPTLHRQKDGRLERGRLTFGELHFPFEGTPSSPIGSQRLYGAALVRFCPWRHPPPARQKTSLRRPVSQDARGTVKPGSNGLRAKIVQRQNVPPLQPSRSSMCGEYVGADGRRSMPPKGGQLTTTTAMGNWSIN